MYLYLEYLWGIILWNISKEYLESEIWSNNIQLFL